VKFKVRISLTVVVIALFCRSIELLRYYASIFCIMQLLIITVPRHSSNYVYT